MKTIKFIAIVALSAAVSMGVAYAVTTTLSGFAAVSIFGGIFVAMAMGAFDVPAKTSRFDSIKHKYGITKKAA